MNFMSYEHLVEECPTIPAVREMFGDCNTYNSNWRDHPNFLWKPQPPQDKQHAQAPQQASNLEQAMVNLSKVVGDFVGAQKSINAQLNQRIDSVESSLNKRMDEEEKREFWPLVLLPLLGHIWSTSSSPFYTYYIPFRSSRSQKSNTSNGVQIGVEMKSYAMKWPLSYKMMCKNTLQSQGSYKMPTEPHNHASKEESPLIEITHEVSHSIFLPPKPSQPIAPTESSS
ncbi:hypothetical protein AAG906_037249 [Vitis piasezkii]